MTNEELISNLRAIDKAASPGPWKVGSDNRVFGGGARETHLFISSKAPWSASPVDRSANAQLAALSKLLLPAMEALEAERSLDRAHHEPLCGECPGCKTRAVLKQLEEALT